MQPTTQVGTNATRASNIQQQPMRSQRPERNTQVQRSDRPERNTSRSIEDLTNEPEIKRFVSFV